MAQTVREETGFRMVRTYVLDGGGGDPIALVYANSPAEEEKNARLIASAPELLCALKAAIELLDDCEISHPLAWDSAIAKAEGQ